MATSIIKPVHAGIKQSFSLPTTSASYTAVTDGYKYTWLSDLVTEGCRVEVEFSSSNTNTTTPYIEYDKKSGGGGIDFTVKAVPTTAIPVVATIICAQTGNTIDIKDIDVSTSTNIGALGANVNEALSSLNSNITTLSGKIFVKQFSASAGLTANEWENDIFNIPVPTHVDRIVLNAQNGASGNVGTIVKRNDGKIRISFSVSSSNPIYISGVVDA